jgi:hypothetical protein
VKGFTNRRVSTTPQSERPWDITRSGAPIPLSVPCSSKGACAGEPFVA